MDLVSVFGILLAFTAILGGQFLEGGHIGSLMQLTAFIIVVGGTTGAIMLQSSPKIFFEGMRLSIWVIWPP
ncbi:MAG: flagellar motor protein, partial [Sulfuricella sp.]|nr:flagellar motor protein [Sulfuricella sp.]